MAEEQRWGCENETVKYNPKTSDVDNWAVSVIEKGNQKKEGLEKNYVFKCGNVDLRYLRDSSGAHLSYYLSSISQCYLQIILIYKIDFISSNYVSQEAKSLLIAFLFPYKDKC